MQKEIGKDPVSNLLWEILKKLKRLTTIISKMNSGSSTTTSTSTAGAVGGPTVQRYNEILIGDVDGINRTFTTQLPFKPGTTRLYYRGIRRHLGRYYSETGGNIVFGVGRAPKPNRSLFIDYEVL